MPPLYKPFYEDPNEPYDPGPVAPVPAAPGVPPPVQQWQVPVPAPGGGGNGGGGGGNGGGGGYGGPVAPDFNLPPVPGFTPPPGFQAPDPNGILNSPAYQFRVNQGNQALQNSAAAKGLTRTGGTLKDFIDYNQNFASQEYGQEFNRARDIYDRTYQAQKDIYAPKLAAYQNLTQAEMVKALAAYQRPWEMYQFQHNKGGGGGGGGNPWDMALRELDLLGAPPTPPG